MYVHADNRAGCGYFFKRKILLLYSERDVVVVLHNNHPEKNILYNCPYTD